MGHTTSCCSQSPPVCRRLRACVRACVRECVRACVRACVRIRVQACPPSTPDSAPVRRMGILLLDSRLHQPCRQGVGKQELIRRHAPCTHGLYQAHARSVCSALALSPAPRPPASERRSARHPGGSAWPAAPRARKPKRGEARQTGVGDRGVELGLRADLRDSHAQRRGSGAAVRRPREARGRGQRQGGAEGHRHGGERQERGLLQHFP